MGGCFILVSTEGFEVVEKRKQYCNEVGAFME
jgi:hypothetical protein